MSTSERSVAGAHGRAPLRGELVVVAHGAGNDLARAARAAALGADIIEADVHGYRGRIEVRHLKTLGRLPVLWDRWWLAPGWRARLTLRELCEEAARAPGPALMFDLKADLGTGDVVAEELETLRSRRRVLVCSQTWHLLEPFHGMPDVTVLHSIGNAQQLAMFEERAPLDGCDGVSIHARLLSERVIGRLRAHASFITTWPINDERRLAHVARLGVDGVTTDSERIIRTVAAARGAAIGDAGGLRDTASGVADAHGGRRRRR